MYFQHKCISLSFTLLAGAFFTMQAAAADPLQDGNRQLRQQQQRQQALEGQIAATKAANERMKAVTPEQLRVPAGRFSRRLSWAAVVVSR